ncbi:MAG: hypothetical protein M1816_005117 [Peltula sp. TS41687]|nr:MAG: hypothetical protein M1816_005117 [Peltula sp. TS41687]
MDAVLVSYMDPNQPEVTRAVRDAPLGPIQDAGETEVDVNGPNGITVIGKHEAVRSSKSSHEDPNVPETDVRRPDGGSPAVAEKDGIASKSSSEDLVNTAQTALHTMAGHLTGVPLPPSVAGSSPRNLGALRGADEAGSLNDGQAHAEPGRLDDPADDARRIERTDVGSESRVSGDAVDALVSLREQSLKASEAHARMQPEVHVQSTAHFQDNDNSGVMRSTSDRPNGSGLMTDETSLHTLPIMSSSHSSALQLEAGPSLKDKPNLPPLRSHLNQFPEVAEQESVQCLDGRNGAGRPHHIPLAALRGNHGRSPPSPSRTHTRHDLSRIPIQYMTTQERQRLIQAQPPSAPNGPFPLNCMSPASSYDETSPQDPFRRSREVTGSSPSPEPSHTSSQPYYLDRRPSHVSEKGAPYHPPSTLMSETPYPTPPTGDGGTFGTEGFHRSPRQESQDHQMDVDPRDQPPQQQANGNSKGGIHRCPHPGCTAPPFQTQYLLNSHANVHSSVRPHYCPVKDCSRGVGGKGFKRKNEMNRHGLVHTSPGYICPFCPDQKHRYPRPDNLQRHVRVNHHDKDKDDPALAKVLSRKPEGGHRGRRRRSGR